MSYLKEMDSLMVSGFTGFVTVNALMDDISVVPKVPGVYVVMRKSEDTPVFLAAGTGGHFNGRNPNVSVDELKGHWVEGASIVYIGKAGGSDSSVTLRKRLKQYMRFGQGEPIGHWGGRYIWQLADAKELIVCWKKITDKEPKDVESLMINEFKEWHGHKRPFANLRD